MAKLDEYLSRKRGEQARLAERLNLGAGTLSAIRSGQRRPSPQLAKRIETATAGEVRASELLGLEDAGPAFDHDAPPRALDRGRWAATVSTDGSLLLTPEMVSALGFATGENLIFRADGDDVKICSSDKSLRDLQTRMKALVPSGVSVVDELILERRAAAARE